MTLFLLVAVSGLGSPHFTVRESAARHLRSLTWDVERYRLLRYYSHHHDDPEVRRALTLLCVYKLKSEVAATVLPPDVLVWPRWDHLSGYNVYGENRTETLARVVISLNHDDDFEGWTLYFRKLYHDPPLVTIYADEGDTGQQITITDPPTLLELIDVFRENPRVFVLRRRR